jgi:cyclase
MLKKRIIPLLLLQGDRLIKTLNFDKFRDVGNPVSTSKIYNDSDADEIILLNISKNKRNSSDMISILEKISENCFIPISAGGGINSLNDTIELIKSGADKIVVNSICYKNYNLINTISSKCGRQAVVASIDVKKINDKYVLFSNCGREREDISLEDHIKKLIDNDVGEILINSIDCEGTMNGPDENLIAKVCNISTVPVISSGGIGNYDHIKNIFKNTNSSAVACGSLFNFTDSNPIRIKSYLKSYDIDLRIF